MLVLTRKCGEEVVIEFDTDDLEPGKHQIRVMAVAPKQCPVKLGFRANPLINVYRAELGSKGK